MHAGSPVPSSHQGQDLVAPRTWELLPLTQHSCDQQHPAIFAGQHCLDPDKCRLIWETKTQLCPPVPHRPVATFTLFRTTNAETSFCVTSQWRAPARKIIRESRRFNFSLSRLWFNSLVQHFLQTPWAYASFKHTLSKKDGFQHVSVLPGSGCFSKHCSVLRQPW